MNSFLPLRGFLSILSDYTALEAVLVVLDILIVATLLYIAFRFIRGTRASRIVAGLAVVVLVALVGRILRLDTLNWLLTHLTTLILVTIPVVFQQELRRGLERIGRTGLGLKSFKLSRRERGHVINELLKTVRTLKANNVGALIVVQRQTGLGTIAESGTPLDAALSTELLLNIFTPKAPLHDGAVVIRANRVLAAGVLLPLSEETFSYEHGTRHRAAMGITESSDAFVLVVSEERGCVSLAVDGVLHENLSAEELEERLQELMPSTN